LITTELRGKKVLVFTYYKDTAHYLYRTLTSAQNSSWRESSDNPTIRRW
jgi:ERCC4-related helicase